MRLQIGRFIVRCLIFGLPGLSFLAFPTYLYTHRTLTIVAVFSGPNLPLLAAISLVGLIILRSYKTFLNRADLNLRRWFGSKEIGTAGSIQVPPGSHLRVFAEFTFSRRTFDLLLEPTLRDLLDEYLQAQDDKRLWKARWVRIRGYWSFWSAVIAQLPISAVKMVYTIWKATR